MAGRNRELVADNWSLVRERALTTGLSVRKDDILNTRVSIEWNGSGLGVLVIKCHSAPVWEEIFGCGPRRDFEVTKLTS